MEFKTKDVLVVGSIAIDTIETPHGRQDSVLGGSAMYFSLSASMFTSVKVVGVVGSDYPQQGWDTLNSRNINTDNIQVENGDTFRWGGKYNQNYTERDTLFTDLGVFENFSPQIHTKHLNTPLVFLGNIHPELQLNVAKQMINTELIVTDTMNLWIDIDKNKLQQVLDITDILLINHEEAEQYTGEPNIEKAANLLRASGPGVVVIKMGSDGAYLSYGAKSYYIPAFKINNVVDPTGAGDSFAGGFLGYLASNPSHDYLEAVIAGTATASFCVENFGANAMLGCSFDSLNSRIRSINKQLKYEKPKTTI